VGSTKDKIEKKSDDKFYQTKRELLVSSIKKWTGVHNSKEMVRP
jgi:hypothetical protein